MILHSSHNDPKVSSMNSDASNIDVNVMSTHTSQHQQQPSTQFQPISGENEWKIDATRAMSIGSISHGSGNGNSETKIGIIAKNGVSKNVSGVQRSCVQMKFDMPNQSENKHQKLIRHFSNSMNGSKSNGFNLSHINDHGSSKESNSSISDGSSNGSRMITRISHSPIPRRNSLGQSMTNISSMPQTRSHLQSHIQLQLKQRQEHNQRCETPLRLQPNLPETSNASSSSDDLIPNVQANKNDTRRSGPDAITLLGVTQIKDLQKQFRLQAERGRRNSSEGIAMSTGVIEMMSKRNNDGILGGVTRGASAAIPILGATDMQQQQQQQKYRMHTQKQGTEMRLITNNQGSTAGKLGSGQTIKKFSSVSAWNRAMPPMGNVISTTANYPAANTSRGTSSSGLSLSKPSPLMMKMYEKVSVVPPLQVEVTSGLHTGTTIPPSNNRGLTNNTDANGTKKMSDTINSTLVKDDLPPPQYSLSGSNLLTSTKSCKPTLVATSDGMVSSTSRRSLASLDRKVFVVNQSYDHVNVARSFGSFGCNRRPRSSIFKNPPRSMDDVRHSTSHVFSPNADWSVKIQPGSEKPQQNHTCFSTPHQPSKNPVLQYAVSKSAEQGHCFDDDTSETAVIGKHVESNQGHELSLDRKPSTIYINETSLPSSTLMENENLTRTNSQSERKTSGLSSPKTSVKRAHKFGVTHNNFRALDKATDDAIEVAFEQEFSNIRDEFTGLDDVVEDHLTATLIESHKSAPRMDRKNSLSGQMVEYAETLHNLALRDDGGDTTGLANEKSDIQSGAARYEVDGSKPRLLKNGRKSVPILISSRVSSLTITENSDEIMPNVELARDEWSSYNDAGLNCGFSESSSSSGQRKLAQLGSLLIPPGPIENSAWHEVLVEEEEATGCSNSNSGSNISKKQQEHNSSSVKLSLDRKPSSVYVRQSNDNVALNVSLLSTDYEATSTSTPFERRLSGLSVSGNSNMFLDSSAYAQYAIHAELPFEQAGVSRDIQEVGNKTVETNKILSNIGRQEVAETAQCSFIEDTSRCLDEDDADNQKPSAQLHSSSRQNQNESGALDHPSPSRANLKKMASCRKISNPNLQSLGRLPPSDEFRNGVNHPTANSSQPFLTNLVRKSSLLRRKSNADLQNDEWSIGSHSKSRSSFANLLKKPSAMVRKPSRGTLQNANFPESYEQRYRHFAHASRPSLTNLVRKPSLLRGLRSSSNLQNAAFELGVSSKTNGGIQQLKSRSNEGGEMTRTHSFNLVRKSSKKDSSTTRLLGWRRTSHDSEQGHGISQKHSSKHLSSTPSGGFTQRNTFGDSLRASCTVTHRCSSFCNDGEFESAKLVDDSNRSGCCLPKLAAKMPTSTSFSRSAFDLKCHGKSNEEWTDQQIDNHFEQALLEATSALGVAIPPPGNRHSASIEKSIPSRSLRRNQSARFTNPGDFNKSEFTCSPPLHMSSSQNFFSSEKNDFLLRPARRHTSDITQADNHSEYYSRRRSFLGRRGSNNDRSPPISRHSSANEDGKRIDRRSGTNNNDTKARRAFNLMSRKRSITRHSSAISTAAVILMKRRASIESMNSSHSSEQGTVETFELEDVFAELLRYDEEYAKWKETSNGTLDWDKIRNALSASSGKKLRWKDFSPNNQATNSNKGNIFHILCKHRPPHDILEQLLVSVHKSEMANTPTEHRTHRRAENGNPSSRPLLRPPHSPSELPGKNPAKHTTWARVLETRDEDDRTPLHVAAASGCSLEALRALIHAHPPVASMTDGQGRSPLILAIMWYFDPTSLNIEEVDMTLRYDMELATLLEIIRIFKSTMTLHPGAVGVMDVDEFGLASFDYAIKGDASDEIIESLKSDDFHNIRNKKDCDNGEEDNTSKKPAERRLSNQFYDKMDTQTTDKLHVDLSLDEDILDPWETESLERAKQLLKLAADREYEEMEQVVEVPPVEEIGIIRLQDRVQRRCSESSLLYTFGRSVSHHTFGDDISEITLPAILKYGIV